MEVSHILNCQYVALNFSALEGRRNGVNIHMQEQEINVQPFSVDVWSLSHFRRTTGLQTLYVTNAEHLGASWYKNIASRGRHPLAALESNPSQDMKCAIMLSSASDTNAVIGILSEGTSSTATSAAAD